MSSGLYSREMVYPRTSTSSRWRHCGCSEGRRGGGGGERGMRKRDFGIHYMQIQRVMALGLE